MTYRFGKKPFSSAHTKAISFFFFLKKKQKTKNKKQSGDRLRKRAFCLPENAV